ncbi:MAG: SusC/RagA family TonB-linked outer membrane protein [Flavobacteriaceae bacterium]
MKNNLEYRGVLRLCLIFLFSFFPPPYLAHFPHGHGFEVSTILLNQQQQISGTVTDPYGPMPGVHVLIKGTNKGTFTDQDGQYSLLVGNTDTLVFSYLGYHNRELPVLGRTTLDVEMQSVVTELQEVEINAGYYTVKERERTGSISRVTAEEIALQPIVSPLEALQGRMAGVEVVQQSGVTGLASSIQIRGQNSLRNSRTDNGNLPLFIVDGVPVNSKPLRSSGALTGLPGMDPLSSLNLSNIESIEVLKDADATAIYGSRGANGVVLITTKRGYKNDGKLRFEAKLYSGISSIPNRVKLLNTEQYIGMRKNAFLNDGVEPTERNAPDLLWDQQRYTDWQDVFFGGTSEVTDTNLSISSGNETTTFLLGGSYHTEGTVFPGDFGYNKITANFSLNHSSKNQKFHLNLSTNYGIDNNRLFNSVNLINYALSLPPNGPSIYKGDGTLNWEDWTWGNPFSEIYKPQEIINNSLLSNMGVSYEFVRGLKIKANFGYSNLDNKEVIKTPKLAYNPLTWDRVNSSSTHSFVQRRSWIIEPQLEYGGSFGKFDVNTLAGLTFQSSQNDLLLSVGNGYSDESLIGNLAAADETRTNVNENIEYNYNAIFGRLGLNWDNTYFINLTGRRDGSSRFGPNKRFSNFGAIGAAWIFSEETFIKKHFPILSFGKLRGSYGTTGSDGIPDYGYLDTYQPTPGPGGLYPTQLTNPDYSWETNRKLETALQLGFIKDRINLGIGWFENLSSNQLVGYPLPATTGFTSVQANLPATVRNTGWEIEVSTINLNAKNFSWQTFLNFTFPETELSEFRDIEQTSYRNRYKVGHPLNIALLYQYDGIDPETGLYKVKDINNDGKYNFDDRTVVKNMGRDYYGGLSNNIRYKALSLQFLFQYVHQNNFSYMTTLTAPGTYGNKSVDILDDRIGSEGVGDIQKLSQLTTANQAYSNAIKSDLAISDASFLRLKTVSLSYQLPSSLLSKYEIQKCSVFVHAQNLFTITNYNGLDPQVGQVVPPLSTITCGVQLNL